MLYHAYELTHATLAPLKALSHMAQQITSSPFNPLSYTAMGRSMAAACEVFGQITRRYDKPQWGIQSTTIEGAGDEVSVPVSIDSVLSTPFCDLLHFKRDLSGLKKKQQGKTGADPTILIVAPLSGHYATLLRGTVRALLPDHEVYVTDWHDARDVPLSAGSFGIEDHTDQIIDFIRFTGPGVSVLGVCQPVVSVLSAVAIMAAGNDPLQPRAMILMGGPIDTRINPTQVNHHAEDHDLAWFERSVICHVPFPQTGFMRKVYPGFVQLSGFLAMNMDRHVEAYNELYNHLVDGDGDSAKQHRAFYDEYLSVMDLPAEFFLETVDKIFKQHALPRGLLEHRGTPVDPGAITGTALMTIEGANDDICGVGQTGAALDLCTGIAENRKLGYVQQGVGHYGIFNGKRWRTEIKPRMAEFIRSV